MFWNLSLHNIVVWLLAYRYEILFPITIIEGPIITIIAGFLAFQGYFNIFAVYGIAVLGDMVGDIIYYSIGLWGGRKFIERWGYFFGITVEKISKLETHFSLHSGKTLLFGKFSHVTGMPILVSAGMAKMPFRKFVWFNFLGTLPKVFLLAIFGYYFGAAYEQINTYFNYGFFIVLLAICALGLIYFLSKKSKS